MPAKNPPFTLLKEWIEVDMSGHFLKTMHNTMSGLVETHAKWGTSNCD